MLRDVAALPSLRKDVKLDSNAEQDAMQWVFNQKENFDHVMYQPLDWYNGYEYTHDTPVVKPGDLLVHFAGYGAGKFPAMGKWLDLLETEEGLSELHVPLNQTDYPLKIKKFWSRLRSARGLLRESGQLANENYPNITNKAVVDKVEQTHKALQQAVHDEAFNDRRVKTGIIALNNALEAADKERETREKAIVGELERQQVAKVEEQKAEQEHKKALEAEKKKEEADKQKNIEKQEQRKEEEAQHKADAAKEQDAKQRAEEAEEQREKEDGGDSGSANQVERAKEQVELEKKQKEEMKKEMMKKNDINEAVVSDGKNQLERIEKTRRMGRI